MSELVENKDDLIRYFEEGGKPREHWRVGTEYEKVAVRTRDAHAMPYSGPGGVSAPPRRLDEPSACDPGCRALALLHRFGGGNPVR